MTEQTETELAEYLKDNAVFFVTDGVAVNNGGEIINCYNVKLGFKNIHKIELFSKKEMKSAYSSGFVKGYFIGIASLTAVAYVIPLIF